MKIQSGIQTDVLHPKPQHGAYEWWYFDGMDRQQGLAWVLIFYEGNPFSPWYLSDLNSVAADYPAVTLSIYKDGKPIYYSFIEYDSREVQFSREKPRWRIGSHKLSFAQNGDQYAFSLSLDDQLPSGDRLRGRLTYHSPPFEQTLDEATEDQHGHEWTLIQPRARVTGHLEMESNINSRAHNYDITGWGYHDHNVGQRPMQADFSDWYWGRLHFDSTSLIYYIMQREGRRHYKAWLLDVTDGRIVDKLQSVVMEDYALSPFLLSSARKLTLQFEDHEALIQQHPIIDNGPFYQRFLASGILSVHQQPPQTAHGISEFIKPARIEWKLFRPLVKMRLYSKPKGPHWVQRSSRLYRWTW
jgi:carotenoid 1,2-hydratase